ncbi:FA desaturase domain containing protein [Asbolus verrucosus]|uniref:FA desaturase domain containing protein n=1 Tax=Asbolus verrucosus TaxID=1661398 RepID=A0A482W8R9_ASBVE|nr:FA desaturase domain containing protein [Asbolus verrucosus]
MTRKSSSAITTITEIKPQKQPYEVEIVWKNVFLFTLLHIAAFSGLYCFVVTAKWSTFFWSLFLVCVSIEGASAGAHRLWCHRSYKAKLPLRILLCIWQTHGLQNDIYEWVRDHRTHHKYTATLHGVWAINSVGHMWGTKPYDKNIHSVENTFINYLTGGEGCHNYHHTFPWDYKSAEFGWAYDRKSVSVQLIEHRARRTGDGSRKQRKDVPLWGWGDKDMNENDMKIIETVTVYGWGDEDMKRALHHNGDLIAAKPKSEPYKVQIVWRNILLFIYLHIAGLYGLYCFIFTAKWNTVLWTYLLALITTQGICAGAHRLWAHRAYKAKLPLRIILCIWQTHALQNHIYEWVRDHRVHHKFSETDADPHNSRRGFFFSHMGWLLCRKHSDVITKGKTVDLSDLEADAVVMFQKKYYLILAPLLAFIVPAWVPWYFWNEDGYISWYTASMFRYALTLHGTWLVNSAAHMWGSKPYDENINAVENITVSYITNGEGFHNYHHVFPWDYKAAELWSYRGNWSTAFIDFMAKIGWAYDLKSVSAEMVERRVKKTGDGSRRDNLPLWGWGDEDMGKEDKKMAEIQHSRRD